MFCVNISTFIQKEEGFPDYGNFDYPQNTSHLFVEDYQPFWEFWVPGVLLPVVGALGLIGNTISIYILSRYLDVLRTNYDISTMIYLTSYVFQHLGKLADIWLRVRG